MLQFTGSMQSTDLPNSNGVEESDYACEMKLPKQAGIVKFIPALIQGTARLAGVPDFRRLEIDLSEEQRIIQLRLTGCSKEVRERFIKLMQSDGYEFMGELEPAAS